MGSIQYKELPQLTPLDRLAPKAYVRYIFPFYLGDDYNIDQVVRVLQTGYDILAWEVPEIACECIPDTDSGKKGALKYRRIEGDDAALITVKDLRESFPWDFEYLRAKGFPVSHFDADIFCPSSIWPAPEEKVRTALVQATFIQGGLIVGWNIIHQSGDGTSWTVWAKIWADGCRRAQGYEGAPLHLPKEIWADRERVRRSSGRNAGRIEDHPEWTLLPSAPTSPPPKMLASNHRGQVFYLCKAALEVLKAMASPEYATEPNDLKWVSTNDALSALLWRTVMAVQNPLETLEGNPISVFNIAINGRTRTKPRVHPQTLGCFMENVAVTAPVREMLSTLTLADLAVRIRKAVRSADEEFTDDTIALEERVDDLDRLVTTAFLDVPGFNCLQTSWVDFDLYSLEWGSILGHRVQAVRTPHDGIAHGLQVVLPRLPDGGMEVLVDVDEKCMDKLLKDPLFRKFAIARN
jgi:hypothetical protein